MYRDNIEKEFHPPFFKTGLNMNSNLILAHFPLYYSVKVCFWEKQGRMLEYARQIFDEGKPPGLQMTR
jgi:hypothetical protein